MPSIVTLQRAGNKLLARYDDNSNRFFLRTPNGFYIPGPYTDSVPTGSGGEQQVSAPTGASPGSVAAPVDDYPWPNAPVLDLSPLRYSYRDCTDFAAWRINRDLGTTSAPWMYTWGQLRLTNGNAIGWRPDWLTHGWGVSTTASPGTIGWYGTKAGSQGHVCYIQAVAGDGTVTIEEYNWLPFSQAYNTNLRTQHPTDALYPDAFLAMPPPR